MREFFLMDVNKEPAYELLQELLASDLFMNPPVFLQVTHLTTLADISKAISAIKRASASGYFSFKATCFSEAKHNVTYYYMNGTDSDPGAKHFFEKIAGVLEEIISLLINNNNTTTITVQSQEITVQDALKGLMSMLYKNYTFTLKETDPSKDFKMYISFDQQMVFRSTVEHRNKLLEELGQWTYSEYYRKKVQTHNPKIFIENPKLEMPAIYSNNKECFYFPLFNAAKGEKGINFGGDGLENRVGGEQCCENFLKVMGFIPEAQTPEDKTLGRTRYANDYFCRYRDNPGCIYFNPNKVIFKDLAFYIRSSNGVLKEEKSINPQEMGKKMMKAVQKELFGGERFSDLYEEKKGQEQTSSSSSSSSSSLTPSSSASSSSSAPSSNSFSFLSSSSSSSGPSIGTSSSSSSATIIQMEAVLMNASGIVMKVITPGGADKIMAALKECKENNLSPSTVWSEGNEITFYASDCQAGIFNNFLKLFNFKQLGLVAELMTAVKALTKAGQTLFTSKSDLASQCFGMLKSLMEEKPEFKPSQTISETLTT